MARPRGIDRSIPIRRNKDQVDMAIAMYAMGVPGPDLLEDFNKGVAVTAVAYAEESVAVAAEMFGITQTQAGSHVNQMRRPTKSGTTRSRVEGKCKEGHNITDPANVWVGEGGRRTCKTCYYDAHPEMTWRKAEGKCRAGHDITDPDSVWVNKKTGRRQCKKCNLRRQREARERKKAADG